MEKEVPQAQIFAYSVKIDCNSKGQAMPTVHVYSNDANHARDEAIRLYEDTLNSLVSRKLPVAVEVAKQ
jgi:hypothetical protein